MDWLSLLAVRVILKSLLQHHSSKASILQHSAFFIVQLSYSYMTPGKTIALTIQTFVGKVMSLLQITADSDCSHEIKRCLLLGRKSMTNLDIILPTRICHSFSSEEESPNFMAAATICSYLGAQENNTYHCFYFFSIY